MRKKYLKLSVFILTLTLLLLSSIGCGVNPKVPVRTADIAVLYTGDVHCALEDNIGYAGLSAYKKSLEAAGEKVLLVDTGDAIQGAAIGSFSKGEDIIRLMNLVGYDVMALGNHEFDYGGPKQVEKLFEIAEFPFLSVNLQEKENGKSLYKGYTILEKDNVKIAFVGVSTPLTLTSSTPAYFMDESGNFIYDFMNDETGAKLFSAVQNAVDAARKEGADYVIALTHLGIDSSTEPYTSNTLIANTVGIDAVLDGHSHSVVECARVKNKDGERVLLSSTGSKLENVGVLYIDKSGNLSTGLVSDITEKDETVTSEIQTIQTKYAEKLNTVLGTLKSNLYTNDPQTGVRLVRNAETNLGDFCADAYRAAGNADIGIVNGGGIRASLKAGEITYGDMLEVHPFGNLLCKSKIKGQVILDALELSVSKMPDENGGFLQVSGISFEVNMSVTSSVQTDENGMFTSINGERKICNVKVNGEAIDPEKEYTVVSINYILKNQGNGYSMFSASQVVMDEFMLDVDALTEYLSGEYQNNSDMYTSPYGSERMISHNASND